MKDEKGERGMIGAQENAARSVGRALREEHALVDRRLAEAKALLGTEFSWDDARVALMALRDNIERHFGFEEHGGYLAEVVTRAPERAAAIERLGSEHTQMRGLLARMLGEALIARDRKELRTAFEAFLATLTDHERRENELVQAVYSTDVSAAD